MATETRKTGIDVVGDMVGWGAHFCLFYETKEDLLDTLISYCKSGLESEEFCLWIVAEPLTIDEATDALKDAVPELDRYLGSRLELAPARDWFLQGGTFDGKRLTAASAASTGDPQFDHQCCRSDEQRQRGIARIGHRDEQRRIGRGARRGARFRPGTELGEC